MDGIFTLIVIIGIANAIIKWVRKQAAVNQKDQGNQPDRPWQRMVGDIARTLEESVTGKAPVKSAPPAPAYKTLNAPVYREGSGTGEGGTSPASVTYQRPATISGVELASSPYSLSSEGTSQPQEQLPQWHGSLPGTEGAASFTTKMAQMQLAPEPVQEMQSALNLSFNRNSLMQAVVMHEILTRPQDRRRRWRPH